MTMPSKKGHPSAKSCGSNSLRTHTHPHTYTFPVRKALATTAVVQTSRPALRLMADRQEKRFRAAERRQHHPSCRQPHNATPATATRIRPPLGTPRWQRCQNRVQVVHRKEDAPWAGRQPAAVEHADELEGPQACRGQRNHSTSCTTRRHSNARVRPARAHVATTASPPTRPRHWVPKGAPAPAPVGSVPPSAANGPCWGPP